MTMTIQPSTGPYAGPDFPMTSEEIILLGGCVFDITAARVMSFTSRGMLTDGAIVASTVAAPSASTVLGLGFENVSRWRNLLHAVPTVLAVAQRLSDDHIEAVLRMTGIAATPNGAHVLDTAGREGGIARALASRSAGIADAVSAELQRATALLHYFTTLPTGLVEPRPSPQNLLPATDLDLGCAVGIFEVYVGMEVVLATVAAEGVTAGAATPAAVLTGAAGVAVIGGGMATVSGHCF